MDRYEQTPRRSRGPRSETQAGFVDGIGQSAAQNQLTAVMGLPRKPEVLFAKGYPARNIVFDYVVNQEIVLHHAPLSYRASCCTVRKNLRRIFLLQLRPLPHGFSVSFR